MDYQNNRSRSHVLNSSFGFGAKNKDMDIWNFVSTHTVTNGIVQTMVLSEIYDETYEIHRHNDLSKPLSAVALHANESYTDQSLEYRKMKEFASLQMGRHFNISFLDYISLPMSAHGFMIKIATELIKKTSHTIDQFKNELEDNH